MLKVEQVNKNHRNNYNSGDPTGQIGPLTQSSGLIIAVIFPHNAGQSNVNGFFHHKDEFEKLNS